MLQRFAAIDIEVREVVILARQGVTVRVQGKLIACDWELRVPSGIFLHMARRATTPVHPVLPTVVIYTGNSSVRLEKLDIPDGVRLLGVEDVVWRSMAILKTADRRSERRIREFIFAWRYEWLKGAVGIAVVAAATLLAVTVVVGRARRARRAEVP